MVTCPLEELLSHQNLQADLWLVGAWACPESRASVSALRLSVFSLDDGCFPSLPLGSHAIRSPVTLLRSFWASLILFSDPFYCLLRASGFLSLFHFEMALFFLILAFSHQVLQQQCLTHYLVWNASVPSRLHFPLKDDCCLSNASIKYAHRCYN